jgi:hypothetical protein
LDFLQLLGRSVLIARVQVVREAARDVGRYKLCFQWCRYFYDDGGLEHGYRFIWRREDNSLQAARGQARIPSIKLARELEQEAIDNGWGDYNGDAMSEAEK